MDHIAIMNPVWKLIPKILSGTKSIESRWYRTRRTPWYRAQSGDTIYFKDSGRPVTLRATASEIFQFQIHSLEDVKRIVSRYGDQIALVNPDPETWEKIAHYCILVRLSDPRPVEPSFEIDKRGFGTGAAWLTIEDVRSIQKLSS